jgi:hypothetical protein
MPATLPTVRGGAVALYPITRANALPVVVQKMLNGSEQRFKRAAPLGNFALAYTLLPAADRDALKAFYSSTKADAATKSAFFDTTWSFTLNNTYTSCTFLDDSFSSVEHQPNLYDVTLHFRQIIKGGGVAGAGSTFPLTSTGATTQRPFTQVVQYRTTKNEMPAGMRYAYAWYGAGLTGFPTRGLMRWKLEFPSISDTDMANLEAFYVAMNGRWQTFSFTDPDSGTVYTKVRFDQDSFTYTYLAKNQASTTIMLAETN